MAKRGEKDDVNAPLRVEYLAKHECYFSDETIAALRELGDVLRSIRKDLAAKGYVIKDGKIYKDGVLQVIEV